ncbi:hypothetical protein HZS_4330 [Henneguya salminicola]|nr:hypothetical protein HZS_4330 [Henneguya salminicola]
MKLNLRANFSKTHGFETYKEHITTNKTHCFNKFMKNKGKYIHNSTFSYILGRVDLTGVNILYYNV